MVRYFKLLTLFNARLVWKEEICQLIAVLKPPHIDAIQSMQATYEFV